MDHVPAAASVAVGVDGTTGAADAAHYAAAVAGDRGWELVVVHAFQVPPPTAGVPVELLTRVQQDADALVDDVLSRLRLGTQTRVHRIVTPSSPVTALRDVSEAASLLVLGRHRPDLVERLLGGRVGSAVAASARCPVVVVPQGWARRGADRRPVVVALDAEGPAGPALGCAFEEAERRQVPVVALHAMALHDEDLSADDEQASLAAVLAGAKQDHPDVVVSTLLVHGDPTAQIVEASVRAGVVVVGRPHHGRRLGSWSRSVARAVLDRSTCPLLVAPPAAVWAPTAAAQQLRRDGGVEQRTSSGDLAANRDSSS